MKKDDFKKGEIIIYKTSKNEVELKVHFEEETVWLRQNEIADLFGKDRSVIAKHIKAIFKDQEVDKKSNVHFLHIANSDKPVMFYDLDVILAVGYRTNSARAIHFRKWATNVLKQYLVKGYAVNEKRLLEAQEKFQELQTAISFLQEKSKKEMLSGQEGEILNLLSNYAKTLTILEQYDKGELKELKGGRTKFILTYEHCLKIIKELRKELMTKKEAGDLFGSERDGSFEGIVRGLYQTFSGKELYPSIEDKASHLLYFVIKDHPFSDGNKRSAAFLFVYFLDKVNYLFKKSGERKINDNALVALSLLIAESQPKEKETMIKIIKNLISE
ncbi:MAG: virulence protein RhuM/Fic/DOC family protein [Candidatus Pacebacteria bacterium]|nr:virulence protein RhuM/Fic/DOC family protein [Candidatus Paceibacterota bacterium]